MGRCVWACCRCQGRASARSSRCDGRSPSFCHCFIRRLGVWLSTTRARASESISQPTHTYTHPANHTHALPLLGARAVSHQEEVHSLMFHEVPKEDTRPDVRGGREGACLLSRLAVDQMKTNKMSQKHRGRRICSPGSPFASESCSYTTAKSPHRIPPRTRRRRGETQSRSNGRGSRRTAVAPQCCRASAPRVRVSVGQRGRRQPATAAPQAKRPVCSNRFDRPAPTTAR